MRAQIDGKDLVVWRATDGKIAAWDNRCPHRGMALSHGFVRGNSLACLYHGWHYDRSGQCSYIPAHPDLDPPATIHAQRHGVVELGGVIWVSVDGDAEGADTGLEPLRSFIVEAEPDDVLHACAETPFNGPLPTAIGDGRFDVAGDTLAVLCNSIAPAQTQVTFLVGPGVSLRRQRALVRWCEAMRRRAEQESGT